MNSSIETAISVLGKIKLRPKGRSMLPFLKEKDEVEILLPKGEIKKYDVVLYKHEDLFVLHRVIAVSGDTLKICGDNSPVMEYVKKGDIIGVMKKEKPLKAFLVKCWYELYIKRIYLFIKRKARR